MDAVTASSAPRPLSRVAELIGGTIVEGRPDLPIAALAGLEDAGDGDLSFFDDPKYRRAALATKASALLVREPLAGFRGAQVRVAMPYLSFMQLVPEFYPAPPRAAGRHPTAVIDPTAKVDPSAAIGPYAVVEAGAEIGSGATLHAHAHVGRGAVVGEGSVLYPHTVVWERSRLGARVIVHSGAVIGDDGFGYRRDESGHRKIPHVGHVEVGDDVEIGCNTTIDRGTFGRTRIGAGTKIDNLVQIAHNVQIGEKALIVAQAGLAGSSRIGNFAIVAGQTGIADHAVVGDGAILIAQSGVTKRAKGGEVYGGSPILPYKTWFKVQSALRFLPRLLGRVRAIEERLGIAIAPEKNEESES